MRNKIIKPYFSYVKDYHGNIRSVVRQDGAVVESADYTPMARHSPLQEQCSPINTEQKK